MAVYEDECIAAGLYPETVEKIADGISKYSKQASKLGLTVFGGTHSGDLRLYKKDEAPLIVAYFDGHNFDGGDGATSPDGTGLMRGES